MAYLETRSTARGDLRYRVAWRPAAGGRPVVTFDDEARAQRFKSLVEAAGESMPTDAVLVAFDLGELVTAAAAPAPALTVVGYCHTYIDSLVKPRPRQIADYRAIVRRHIEPFFTDMALADVTRAHLREWQRWAEREGGHNGGPLAGSSVARVRAGVLYPMFKMACARQDDGKPGPRTWNPFDELDAPRTVRNPVEFLRTEEEAAFLVRGAYAVDLFTGDAVVTLLASAMRFGELFGLTAPAVVPSRRLVEVRTVAALDDEGRGRYRLRAEPKSDDGWRTLAYPPELAGVIERRHGAAAGPHRLLWASPVGGDVVSYTMFSKRYDKAIKAATALGLTRRVTPHGLRHSALTHLGETAGVPTKAVQRFAGHANEATTQGYMHNTGRGDSEVTAALGAFLAQVVTGTPAAA
jgi:integrase